MLLVVAAHGGNLAHLHRIQHRRNGAHIILTQQQPEQPGEMLPIPMGLPQNVVELFQGRQKDFPKLAENLGFPVVPGGIILPGKPRQPLFQTRFFQVAVHGKHLVPEILRIPEAVIQMLQRRNRQLPCFI